MNHPKDLHSSKNTSVATNQDDNDHLQHHCRANVFKRINCCSHSLFINLFPARANKAIPKRMASSSGAFLLVSGKVPRLHKKTSYSPLHRSITGSVDSQHTQPQGNHLFSRTLAFQANHSFQRDINGF